uniref:CSD2 domain-containing protein n=1 Tax=Phlebotomus papatasi TaxID=29031 RepID=A0A1B0DD73_PHLPP
MDNCQNQSSEAKSGAECQNSLNKNSQHAATGNISNVLATLEALKLDFERNSVPEGEVFGKEDLKLCVNVPEVPEEESADEEVVECPGKNPGKKKRTRSKKKGKKSRSSDERSVVEIDNGSVNGALPELLTDGNILILQLLSMDAEEREEYLMKSALERNLLVFLGNGNRTKLEINPVIYNYLKKSRHNGEHVKMQRLREIVKTRRHATTKGEKEQKDHREKGKGKSPRKSLEMSEIEEKYLEVVEAEAQGPAKILPDAKLTESLKAFAAEVVSAKKGTLIEGEIRVSVKNYHNSYMANPTGAKDIIFRSSLLRRHALPGDHVLALIFKTTVQETKAEASLEDEAPEEDDDDEEEKKTSESSSKAPEEPAEIEEREVGVVIEILKEGHNRLIVGTFQRPISNSNLLTPRDSRLPRVRITTDDLIRGMSRSNKMMMNFIFLAKIMYSAVGEVGGKLLRIVGQVGELESENRAILMANDLNPEPYPAELLAQLPPFEIRPEDVRKRLDLRTNTCIFTIDPLTARDLDDAVSCVQVDKDIFEEVKPRPQARNDETAAWLWAESVKWTKLSPEEIN